jgi:NAD/NADP transhydrogenase beta subunit
MRGNVYGLMATGIAVGTVVLHPGFQGWALVLPTATLAGAVGLGVAYTVEMEQMPQLVAGFHSFVGLSAVFVGYSHFLSVGATGTEGYLKAIETFLGVGVGAATFTGSVVAAGKLHGFIPGKPIGEEYRTYANLSCLVGSLAAGGVFVAMSNMDAYVPRLIALAVGAKVFGCYGVAGVLPIGGADMPIVVSLLNSVSGLATSSMGLMLGNNLVVTGAWCSPPEHCFRTSCARASTGLCSRCFPEASAWSQALLRMHLEHLEEQCRR